MCNSSMLKRSNDTRVVMGSLPDSRSLLQALLDCNSYNKAQEAIMLKIISIMRSMIDMFWDNTHQ